MSSNTEPHRGEAPWFGMTLFTLYCVAYAAFVVVAAFATFREGKPAGGLATEAFGGLPWGIVAGFGLIAGAFVLALIYAIFGRVSDEGMTR